MQHHAEVLTNLRIIREMGIRKWTLSEEDRWSCPQCRAKISWYDKACSKCGSKRSDRLFPLKQA
jgi:predicted amidophosphoribosyltransferase